jgi:tagatose-6-phosphate ketose/aldose isomerase
MSKSAYLDIDLSELSELGALYTAKEIDQQPQLWLDTYELLKEQKDVLGTFLKNSFAHPSLKIILTGAGTSAYIGNVLQGSFYKNTGKDIHAIATTDLVSHPHYYFSKEVPTLLLSFARSGNSPESLASVDLANKLCDTAYHLIITCNPDGKLAVQAKNDSAYFTFCLPPEADDQSLAMTGSFSSMLLTGLLISRIHEIEQLKDQVITLAGYGNNILKRYLKDIREVARLGFQRAVFLGSGPLQGTARESQLKLQELTDGKVICKYDSFLGFRHGPKAVINPETLLVYIFSNNEYAHQYEVDLINTINLGERGLFQIGITESPKREMQLDLKIILSEGGGKIDEEFLSVCSVLPSQLLGLFKSLELGLKPDSPSVNQTITRVVQGVTIYPYFDSGKTV